MTYTARSVGIAILTLRGYLNRHAPSDWPEVRRRLELLSGSAADEVTYQFVVNIWAKTRLGRGQWGNIVQMLLAAAPNIADLRAAITQSFQGHILQGGCIRNPLPTMFGRAINKDRFYELLVKQRFAVDVSEAHMIVSSLIKQPIYHTQQTLKGVLLGRYLMWATFNTNDMASDPFDSLPGNADGIRARLGLDIEDAGNELLLLVYALPMGTTPLFPTVADAYSAQPWAWYFRPSLPSARHGITMPWPKAGAPCPEVVHAPITGETLARSLRIVS